MQEKSTFVHRLARLLKFWSHSVLVHGFFNGRSYTMELFAVMASEHESNDDILRGFRIALDMIRNYRKVRKVWTRFYSTARVETTWSMSDCGCLLLDPTDPVNNLLA